jgi:hypothetical protein
MTQKAPSFAFMAKFLIILISGFPYEKCVQAKSTREIGQRAVQIHAACAAERSVHFKSIEIENKCAYILA